MSLIEKIDAMKAQAQKLIVKQPADRLDEIANDISEGYIIACDEVKNYILSEQKEPCNYTLEDDDANTWECNKCEMLWQLEAGTPKENEMNYCPKCGREIIG